MDDYYHDTDCDDIPLSEAYDLIDTAPTVERPHGEWLDIYKSHIAYECSCCGMQTPVFDYYHFCPNCGADMRGGKND